MDNIKIGISSSPLELAKPRAETTYKNVSFS